MFMLAVQTNEDLETIDHKFLEPGHTNMECDIDHSVIERKRNRLVPNVHLTLQKLILVKLNIKPHWTYQFLFKH